MTTDEGRKVSEEAYAYTPGLKAKLATVVYRTRRLPISGEVLVKVGDVVGYDTIVARTHLRGDPEILNISMLLGVEPEDVLLYMKKKEGDRVAEGEVIASYSTFFGLVKKSTTSPIEGNMESISEESGQITIRGRPMPVEVSAYVPGRVVEVLPREGAVIKTNASFIQGIFGVGGETHGRIRMAVNSPDEELTAASIGSEDKGAVLIGGSLVTLEALRRGVEVGVSAIVAGGISHRDITAIMKEEIGVAITGTEDVGLTLIITEGFGKMRMSHRTFDLLKRFQGYLASLSGATQIRAGVIRPEIIIPHEESSEKLVGDELAMGLVIGTPVRIIKEPHFGAIGKVVGLPSALKKIRTESEVRVLGVELGDGSLVTVPRANVEIIEE